MSISPQGPLAGHWPSAGLDSQPADLSGSRCDHIAQHAGRGRGRLAVGELVDVAGGVALGEACLTCPMLHGRG